MTVNLVWRLTKMRRQQSISLLMPYLHVATPLDRSSQLWLHPSFLKREVRNTRTKKGRRQEGSRPQQGLEITGRRQTPLTQDSRQIEGAEDAHGRAVQEARRFQDPCRCPAGQCGRFVQRVGSIRQSTAPGEGRRVEDMGLIARRNPRVPIHHRR